MSDHVKNSLTAVLIGSALLAVGCQDDPLTFDNPVDPQNPDSPFYEPLEATSGVGAHDNSSGVAVQDVSFGWDSVTAAQEYEFQLATDSAFSEAATIEQVTTSSTEVGPLPLATDQGYHWRARFLASVPFEEGSQAVWGPWHEYELEFVVPEVPEQENTLSAVGTIQGVPVELDGSIPSPSIDSGHGIWLDLESTHPESSGSRVSVGFRPRGLSPGLYTMPAAGPSGICAYVGSDLIEEVEGYYANLVDDDSRILISEVEQRGGGQTRIAGTFDLDTNIDDTLSGGFNVVVEGYTYGDGNGGNPIEGGEVTSRTIAVDGDPGDWNGVESVIVEQTGDSRYPDPSGDITRVSVAADATYLYFMMDVAGDVPHTEGDFEYRVWIQDGDAKGGTNAIEIGVDYDGDTASGYASSRETGEWQPISGFQFAWAAVGSVIEFQIDRAMIHFPDPISVRGHLHRNALEEDPDRTGYWRFSLP